MQRLSLAVVVALLALGSGAPRAQAPAITVAQVSVDASKPGPAIPATMFGIFFEDINFAADGGLYAEQVKNRSFEFPDALMAWKKSADPDALGEFAIRTDRPASPANPHYLRVTVDAPAAMASATTASAAVGVEAGKRYIVTMLARRVAGTASLKRRDSRTARLEEAGSAAIATVPGEWGVVTATITPPRHQHAGAVPRPARGPGRGRPRHGVAVSRPTPGRTGRTGCARTWCRCWPT